MRAVVCHRPYACPRPGGPLAVVEEMIHTDTMGTATRASLRTPRSAGVAGIIFSVLLGGVFLLIRLSVPSSEAASSAG